ncbi:hypothetical protein [Streptomyces sp. NPDC018055]|uniref:hypothetical protein n=1 Tax=Streptomyces sp. NPDC018055 TaxID=3365038 RepID=UPI0037AB8C93
MQTRQIAPDLKVVALGGTIRLTHRRPDGGRLEMSLTRGERRSTAVYAVTRPDGTLRVVTARSWANGAPPPVMGETIGRAIGSAS